jgi:hypothetical protein
VPERPALRYAPDIINCGDLRCVLIELEDWQSIRYWFLSLERELKAACLAAGGSPAECRTESEK